MFTASLNLNFRQRFPGPSEDIHKIRPQLLPLSDNSAIKSVYGYDCPSNI